PFRVRVMDVAQHPREDAQPTSALPELLPQADVVVNLLPLSPATAKFVDRALLEQMKPGALFVNAGRGKTVDTEALLGALRAGHIRAALDVADPEPLPDGHPLWHAANVPACAVARRLADLVDRIDQRENRSGLGRHDLEPNAIGAPPHFEQAGRLERQNFALVVGQAMPRLELKWGANLPFVHDYLV